VNASPAVLSTCSRERGDSIGQPASGTLLWTAQTARSGPPLRIVFLIPRLHIGGVQRQLCLLACGLRAAKDRVLVATLVPGGEFLHEFRKAAIPVVVLGDGERPSPRLLSRLLRLLDCERPDILYSYLPSANILSALAKALRPETRLVWGLRLTSRETGRDGLPHRLVARAERSLRSKSDMLIANAPSVRSAAITAGFPAPRVRVIPNGFDPDRFRFDWNKRQRLRRAWGVTDGLQLIGVVGRLDVMKGHEVFLEAARHLAGADPKLRFVCVGPDYDGRQAALEAHSRGLGISELVSWPGPASDMAAVYSALDLLCQASIFGEGFPNSVTEALLCGLPCVGTDVGHTRELLSGIGSVVPVRDPHALAAACRDVLSRSAGERRADGGRARERIAREFPAEAMVAATSSALRDLARPLRAFQTSPSPEQVPSVSVRPGARA